jgi:hypothetical protein
VNVGGPAMETRYPVSRDGWTSTGGGNSRLGKVALSHEWRKI